MTERGLVALIAAQLMAHGFSAEEAVVVAFALLEAVDAHLVNRNA